MASLRSLKAKELTPELQQRRRQQRHRRLAYYEDSLVLLDPKPYQREDDLDGDKAIDNAKDLASLLNQVPAPSGTLKCKGWFEDDGKEQLYFVFFAPPGCSADANIVTLLEYFSQPFKPSLTARLRLACFVARTIQHIHENGFYHKGLRSDGVIFFRRPSVERSLGDPFVAGFDSSRKAEPGKWSEKLLDTSVSLYRHPSALQDLSMNFCRRYDYYSLGVMLVEIAFWNSIRNVLSEHPVFQRPEVKHQDALKIRDILLDNDPETEGNYGREIAFRMGDQYADVVELCLSGRFGRAQNDDKQDLRTYSNAVVDKLHELII